MSGVEGNIDESVAKEIREDRAAECSVFVEDLVDDVVLGNLALVAGNDGSGVVLNNAREGASAGDSGHPRWELAVPLRISDFKKRDRCHVI